jgi:hypothetical protein
VRSFATPRGVTARRLGAAALASVAGVALTAAPATPAQAATTLPPTVTSSFTPNLIGVGGTSALGITITNPNSSGALSAIAFNDTLPTDLVIDNPNGESGTCGSSGVVTANPGSNSFSLGGGSLKASTSCTVSVAVTAAAAEVVQNSTGLVSSSAGTSASGDTEDLTVLAAPTVTVRTPKNNAVFNFGQRVIANFACGQAAYVLGLADCSGADDLGNTIDDGQALVTDVPGAHQLSVFATSITGLVSTDVVNYKVLPDNRFTVTKIKRGSGGKLSFQLPLPGAGKVQIAEQVGKTTVAAEAFKVKGKQTKRVTVPLNARGLALLAKGPFKVRLTVSYKPTGGVARTVTVRGVKLS